MELTLQNESGGTLTRKEVRQNILDFEEFLFSLEDKVVGDNDVMPLTHKFSEGIYVREIFIPKDMYLTGAIHKHEHPNFLLEGEVDVFTEYAGWERLEAPQSIISKAGTKRVVHTITDTRWVTVHLNPTNMRDTVKLRKSLTVDTFEQYDKFEKRLATKTKIINILKSFLP